MKKLLFGSLLGLALIAFTGCTDSNDAQVTKCQSGKCDSAKKTDKKCGNGKCDTAKKSTKKCAA
jgi:uncharacterized low-complexity protein